MGLLTMLMGLYMGEHTEAEKPNHDHYGISSSYEEKLDSWKDVFQEPLEGLINSDVSSNDKLGLGSVQLNAGRPKFNSVRPNINTGRTNINSVGDLLLRPQQVIIGGPQDQTSIIAVDLLILELYIVYCKIMVDRGNRELKNIVTVLARTPNRTPQQNGVAERMNRTLIEAARTMLADSLLPTTFWAEAVSTACYIFNRVRVTKPQNKTPYELLFGHKPIISYIRPFGCHVTILDTLSVLGKFDGKSDEGFLVGYSLNSKAYRVYNLVTKRVEVNLHVNFLEDKPNVKGVGYRWMFDIDYLTDSMNYIPVSLENQANPHAGASEVTNSAGTPKSIASEEKDEEVELIVVPTAVKIPEEKDESRTSSTNSKKEETLTEPQKEKKDSSTDSLEDNPKIQAFRRELEEIALKHLGTVPENNTTSTPSVNTGSQTVNTGSQTVNTGSQTVNTGRLDHDDSLMPELEIFHKPETGIFDEASYD
ncbi:ribonuclease H-like domain-containing protein, partial [Tanacetum coccineum]